MRATPPDLTPKAGSVAWWSAYAFEDYALETRCAVRNPGVCEYDLLVPIDGMENSRAYRAWGAVDDGSTDFAAHTVQVVVDANLGS